MLTKTLVAFCLCVGVTMLVGYFRSFDQNVNGTLHMTKLDDALLSLKTGDLLFTRSENWTSKLQMYFCQTYVNHCCMVYKVPETGELWVWDVSPREGAYMLPLVDFVRYNWKGHPPRPSEMPPIGIQIPYANAAKRDTLMYKSAIYIRRLHKPLDDRLVLKYLQDNIGRPYSYRWWWSAVLSSAFVLPVLPIPWSFAQDKDGMFCSEIIGKLYSDCGFLETKYSPVSSIMPSHLWTNDIHWKNGQGLQDAEQLIGKEDDIPIFRSKVNSFDANGEENNRLKFHTWEEGAKHSTSEEQAIHLVNSLWNSYGQEHTYVQGRA
jgi:hypothetical protein